MQLKSHDIRYLVVHCSDTEDEADPPVTAADIHALHLGFGWHGIGYHAVIERDGEVVAGRPEYWQGAHVRGHNGESLGVCLVGRTRFSEAQLASLRRLLAEWQGRYPEAAICGHCDFASTEKTCPNFDVAGWWREAGGG